MIPAAFYSTIYLAVLSFLTLFTMAKYAKLSDSRLRSTAAAPMPVGAIILTLAVTLFIGYRPESYVFVDMMNYRDFYRAFSSGTFHFDPDATNLIFDNVFDWMSKSQLPIRWFYLGCAVVYFGALYLAMRKMFPRDTYYAILIYLVAFSTFTYGTNGIKAGAAASVFLMALAYRQKPVLAAVFLFISWGIHHSMIVCIVAYILACLNTNSKLYFGVWLFCVVLAMLHITAIQEIFAGLSDEQGANYLSTSDSDWGGKSGFRLDFLIYSAAPVALGYWVIFKRGLRSKMYTFLFNTYLTINAVWVLCMYASFTNRIAYLSWLMLPIVLIYPFFRHHFIYNQYQRLNTVALWHLLFTLGMSLIYYGLLR